ncbi:hypothetical protein C8F04DRAFT_1242484 [Mycena alexandri]|uniref:Uncharacterized protein n=1 Tax=Mycena alexandri TaxID=1745969 RepID=A0AAD6S386_9AGAR|nr:hypothetical protein C8F04DRAFT_1242484 [Mycena alexandri]
MSVKLAACAQLVPRPARLATGLDRILDDFVRKFYPPQALSNPTIRPSDADKSTWANTGKNNRLRSTCKTPAGIEPAPRCCSATLHLPCTARPGIEPSTPAGLISFQTLERAQVQGMREQEGINRLEIVVLDRHEEEKCFHEVEQDSSWNRTGIFLLVNDVLGQPTKAGQPGNTQYCVSVNSVARSLFSTEFVLLGIRSSLYQCATESQDKKANSCYPSAACPGVEPGIPALKLLTASVNGAGYTRRVTSTLRLYSLQIVLDFGPRKNTVQKITWNVQPFT